MSTSANFLRQFIKFPTTKPSIIAPPCQQRITIPRIHTFAEKIHKLKRQHNEIQCITDYDHTLTKFKHENKRCDSLFGMWVKNPELPQKFKEDLLNNYMYYGPYQTDGSITFLEKYELINQFYYVQTKLFQTNKITLDMARSTLDKSNIVFRAYTKRMLEQMHDTKIPLYIVSGGISDIIYTTIHDIIGQVYPNISIHSNEMLMYKIHEKHGGHVLIDYQALNLKKSQQSLRKSSQQVIKQHFPQVQKVKQEDLYLIKFRKPLIHSYNKFQIMKNHTSKRKNCILMGDLQSDIYMARGVKYETIFSIFYAKEGDTDQRAYAEEKFDLIIQGDGSHKIVVQLLKIIKGKKNINWDYLTSVHKDLHQYLV